MAQVKSGLNDGAGFQPSDTVTQSNLNNHINSAQVVNIANADIASNAGIVASKLQSVAGNSLIFNATSGSATPTEQPIVISGGDSPSDVLGLLYDDNTFSQADTANGAVRGATQQSIKQYVSTVGFPLTAPSGTSMSSSGSVSLPSGLVMKFGQATSTADGDQVFSFPSAFDNNCFCVMINRLQTGANLPLVAINKTVNGFTINRNNAIDGSSAFTFLALGN